MRTISFDSLNNSDAISEVFGVQTNYDVIHVNASKSVAGKSSKAGATKQTSYGGATGKGYDANKSQKNGSQSGASLSDDINVDVGSSRSSAGFDISPSDYHSLFSPETSPVSSNSNNRHSVALKNVSTATTLDELVSIYKNCERCSETISRLHRDKVTLAPFSIKENKKIKVMIITEMFDDSEYNEFLANNVAIGNGVINGGCVYYGSRYEMLERMMTSEKTLGISMNEVYISSVVKCCFSDKETAPSDIANCSDYLLQEIRLVNPSAIITFSSKAVLALFGEQKGLDSKMEKLFLYDIESEKNNLISIPTACFKSLSYISGLKDKAEINYKNEIRKILLTIKDNWQNNLKN